MASSRLHYSNTHLVTYHIPGVVSASANDADLIFVAPRRCKIVDVRAASMVAAATTSVIFDLNINGTTAFTTQANRPTIVASSKNSTSVLPDVVTLAEGDEVTIDVDQADTGPTAADIVIQVEVAPY